MDMTDQLARSIKVSDLDSQEKDRRLKGVSQAIEQFAKTGNYEDAPIAAMRLAATIRNDEWLQSSQERYMGMTEDMKKANELDVSDAQRYAMQKHFKSQGATPTQKNKLGTYGRYSSFDVFKEPNIQEELGKFMKDAEASYKQEIQDDGTYLYVRGNERKTKEDLLRLGMQYISNDPKMAKLMEYETDMHVDSAPPELREKIVGDQLSELRKTQKAYADAGQTKEADYLTQLINQKSDQRSAKGGVDKMFYDLTREQVINKHTGNIAEAYSKDRETISNLRLRNESGSGSGGSKTKAGGIDYFGYTGRGGNIYTQKAADELQVAENSKSIWTDEALAGTGDTTFGAAYRDDSGVNVKGGNMADKHQKEVDSYYKSKDFTASKAFLESIGIAVATPENTKKSTKQIAEEVLASSANIPAPKIRLGDKSMSLIGVQEDENGRPIGGNNSFTLMLPKENGGGSYANLGNLQALEAGITKTMSKVEDLKFTYTKQGISPANPQGMAGAVVYTVTATGKDSKGAEVSMDFDMLRSNDNKRMGQAFEPLQNMAKFAYSGKPGTETINLGGEILRMINTPTIGSDGTTVLSTTVTSSNPARKPMTFENFVNEYGMQIFNTQK